MGRGSLIINEDIVGWDAESILRYGAERRQTYSFFQQMARLTRDRGSLAHDDRLDALEGAVRHFVKQLAIDQEETIKRQEAARWAEWAKDPLQRNRYGSAPPRQASILNNYRRR